MNRLPFFFTLSWSAAALLALPGCGIESPGAHASDPPSASEGESSKPLQKVAAAKPERKTLRLTTVQPARIEAFEQAPLLAKLAGYVQQVHVDIGDRVEQDQVLIELAIPELDEEVNQKAALVEQAEAEIGQAQAAVQAAEAAAVSAEAKIAEAQAGIARAQGQYDRWKSEHARIAELAEAGSVTRRLADETLNQFRAAQAERDEAAARVESAKAGVVEARAKLEKSKADLVAAQARLKVAQANRAQAAAMHSYTQIRAPFDGTVTERHVHRGHFVQPARGAGARPLLVVARTDVVRVFVDVPEVEAPRVADGDWGQVQIQALGGQKIEAKVARSSYALTENRTLRTELNVDNPAGLLRPGMYAKVQLLLDERADVVVLPQGAIVYEGEETLCCCVVDGKIERRPVALGLPSGGDVEIISGLAGDEIVVQARAAGLQQGQRVEVLQAE